MVVQHRALDTTNTHSDCAHTRTRTIESSSDRRFLRKSFSYWKRGRVTGRFTGLRTRCKVETAQTDSALKLRANQVSGSGRVTMAGRLTRASLGKRSLPCLVRASAPKRWRLSGRLETALELVEGRANVNELNSICVEWRCREKVALRSRFGYLRLHALCLCEHVLFRLSIEQVDVVLVELHRNSVTDLWFQIGGNADC